NGDRYLYTGIARNTRGFRELNSFLSYYNQSKLPLPERAPPLEDVWFIYDLSKNPWQEKIRTRTKLRDQELIGVRPGEVNRLLTSRWNMEPSRLVMRHPVTFLHKNDHALHRHLRAIDHNILLSQLKPEQMAGESEVLLSPDLLRCAYDEVSQIRRNTEELIKNCRIDFDFTTVKNKKTFTGTAQDDRVLLEKLAMDGMEYRYGL
ncbi:MAG: DNA polymerase III subunit alpha, partial [bacterium]|nr:DNA polymerase III subunit alpha [bacterium]